MTRDEVEKRFADLRLVLDVVNDRVRDTLRPFCERNGYPYMGRLKTVDSVADKIESGRFARWSDLDDLVGYSIIVPSLDLEGEVLEFLKASFKTRLVKQRGAANKSPDSFRFDSTRYVGSLIGRAGESDDEPLFKIEFEIQIRSAFEHAWSVTTHKTVYKPEVVDWRRLRLAAQLKAAVEQLDSLVVAFDKLSEGLSTSAWPEVDAQVKIVDAVVGQRSMGAIDHVSMPSSLGRFSESVVSMVRAGKRSNFKTLVRDIDGALDILIEASNRGDKCPKSLSAFQWWFTILANANYLANLPADYPFPLDTSTSLLLTNEDFCAFDWHG